MFELQRLWDYWPHLRNVKGLKSLFHQSSDVGSARRVFVIPGHVFLFVPSGDGDNGCLHVFDCVPRGSNGAKEQVSEPAPLLQSRVGILEVLELDSEGAARIAVVQRNGDLSLYRFDTATLQWNLLGNKQLGAPALCSVAFCGKLSTFVYCEQLDDKKGYRVSSRKLEKAGDGGVSLAAPEVIMSDCPPLTLHAMANWICLVPRQGTPYPDGLVLFWCAGEHCIQGYVWNSSMLEPRSCNCKDFKTICLYFSSLYTTKPERPVVVAMTSNTASNQLVILGSDGQPLCFSYDGVGIKQNAMHMLLDTPPWLNSLPALPQSGVTLTSLYTYWCLFSEGVVRVYDSLSGELVWQCDNHAGIGTVPWFSHSPLQFAGLLTEQDIWVLKSKQMSSHAKCMIDGYLPVSVNTEEVASGNDYANSYWLSHKLCQTWGLDLQATRYCLDTVYSLTKDIDEEALEDNQALPYLPQQVVDALPTMCLQNPSLSVALLVKFPMYKTQLKTQVNDFIDSYKSGGNWLLNTQLNADTAQMLMEFVQLCNKYDTILDNCLTVPPQPATTIKQHVINILTQAYTTTIVGDDGGSNPLELHSLVQQHPQEVLDGIREFLGVHSFKQAVEELSVGRWSSAPNVNWKRVFANETVRDEVIHGSTAKVPLYELTCRLLYQLEPPELVQFVEFAKLYRVKTEGSYMREHTMTALCQRALEAITPLVSDYTGVVGCSPDAVKEYCQLLLMSQCPNAEMAVTNLLVGRCMWTDAILLVRELKKKSDDTRSSDIHRVVFHKVLSSLSEGGVLKEYLEEMWDLVPKQFSVFDFLHVLKDATAQSHDGVFVEQESSLAVRDVVSKLLKLLQTSQIDSHLLDVSTVRHKL